MNAPALVPCLIALRAEFNACSPARDKRSDGWIGNKAHALTSSDHNPDESGATPYEDADNVDEVHGLDVDDTGPWPAPAWFDAKVEHIRREHAAGRDNRLQNIIRNGRIASRSWGWAWRPYNGANGHYEHAHFSARYTTAQENDTSPWGVYAPEQESDVSFADDKIKLTETAGKELYEPDKAEGSEVYASSVLQLAAIWAKRAALDAAAAKATADSNAQTLDGLKATCEQILNAVTVPPAPPTE